MSKTFDVCSRVDRSEIQYGMPPRIVPRRTEVIIGRAVQMYIDGYIEIELDSLPLDGKLILKERTP